MLAAAPTSSTLAAPRPAESDGRLPSLDGLRAISILLVMLSHLPRTGNAPFSDGGVWIARRGAVGVDVFFAISGFLITTLLLRENARTGTMSLRGFYLRRAIRIFPAFFAYLGVMAIAQQLGAAHLSARDWLTASTYTVNFFPPIGHLVQHVWSLSVEEHFYLVWPPLLLLLGSRRGGILALACLFAEPIIRWCTHHYAGKTFDIDYVTFTRLDAIAAGCVLAVMAQLPAHRSPLRRLDVRPAAWFFGAVIVLAASTFVLAISGKYTIIARHWVDALAICVMIRTSTRFPTSSFGRVLNWAPLAWLGRLSYSLYLWQEVFLNQTNPGAWICRFPQNIFLSILAAMFSYYLIERPCLRLKPRGATDTSVPAAVRRTQVVVRTPGRCKASSAEVQMRVPPAVCLERPVER
jgi:peptidoglycan/LPS O-acetylase OafA/YrhL